MLLDFILSVTVVRSISKESAKRHEVMVYTITALNSKHDFSPREEDLIKDMNWLTKFSKNCRNIVESEFSLEEVIARLEKVYGEIARR